MKLADLAFIFLKENKHKNFSWKQGQNFLVDISCYQSPAIQHICKFNFCCVIRKRVTEHVIILKEIVDKQDSFFLITHNKVRKEIFIISLNNRPQVPMVYTVG